MAYTRGHTKNLSSFGGAGYSVLPPLSVPDTLRLQTGFVLHGLRDAFKVELVLETLATNKITQANTFKSSILQGVVLISALAIKPLLGSVIPRGGDPYGGGGGRSESTTGIAYWLFHILWLYPLSLAATYYSGLLRSQEAERRGGVVRSEYRGVTANLAAQSYKFLILLNYLLFTYLLSYVPFFGSPISFIYACVVDSYYCFENQWLKSGWSFGERVKQLEERWGYFIGFGLPITLFSWWSADPVVNLALFSLLFPFYQIMSTVSIPQPLDPRLPTSSMTLSVLPQLGGGGSFSMAAAEGGEEARGRKGNPLVPVRIRVLFLAEAVYENVMKGFIGQGSRKKDAGGHPGYGHEGQHHYGHGGHGQAPGPPPSAYGSPGGAAGYGAAYGDAVGPGVSSGYGPAGGGYGGDVPFAGNGAAPVGAYAQSPPRRGHQMSESSVGVGAGGVVGGFGATSQLPPYGAPPPPPPPQSSGYAGNPPQAPHGEFADRRLDSLIRDAGKRRKGD
ncbi:hypothetical protein T439DRAFT_320034 [Meredithblackwellia eburnea MCA 4105]